MLSLGRIWLNFSVPQFPILGVCPKIANPFPEFRPLSMKIERQILYEVTIRSEKWVQLKISELLF